ncbi:hypothetical protein GF362_01425 [Candidatus Dojkabacteria bacterium]|nr:hypothetical protein [Candidatus Dojkabacteria bacterium]
MADKKAKAPDEVVKSGSSGESNDKVLAAVSAIPLVGLIVYLAMKDASDFVKNYARQGAMLFIVGILGFIPLVNCVVIIVEVVGILMLLINALQEKKDYKLPVLGDLAEKIFK